MFNLIICHLFHFKRSKSNEASSFSSSVSKNLFYWSRKAEIACMKLHHNLNVILNTIPVTLHDQKVGDLLTRYNGDMNAVIQEECQKI